MAPKTSESELRDMIRDLRIHGFEEIEVYTRQLAIDGVWTWEDQEEFEEEFLSDVKYRLLEAEETLDEE